MKYGLIPELVGRLPVITVLEELNEEALIEILTKPKNAIVRQYQVLFAMEDVDIEFTPEALKAIAHQAIERKTGARGLRSIIEALLLDTMFEIPSRTDVAKVIVTEAVVTAKAKPEYVLRTAEQIEALKAEKAAAQAVLNRRKSDGGGAPIKQLVLPHLERVENCAERPHIDFNNHLLWGYCFER